MTAEKMFKEYKSMKREESILRFQLGRFQGVDENDIIITMQMGGFGESEKVQTSTVSDKTASAAMNYRAVMERENEEWFRYLLCRYRYVREEIDFFERSVSELPEIQSGVIRDLLDDEMTWDSIAARYHVSRTMIAKYKKVAMAELGKRYALRDKQTEDYIFG